MRVPNKVEVDTHYIRDGYAAVASVELEDGTYYEARVMAPDYRSVGMRACILLAQKLAEALSKERNAT